MLGPDPEDEIAFRQRLTRRGNGNVALAEPDRLRAGLQAAAERQEVHRRRADEICNEQRRRPVIDVARARDLLDDAVVHHGDHVGHRHGLELIMRDIDRRRAEPVMQRAQFTDHRLAHFGIERAERLVHQETFRLAHDRPPERDALPVAAGKTRHRPVEKMRNAQDARRFHHPPVGLRRADALAFQGKADVSPDIHVRIEGEQLEHEGDIAGRCAVHRDVLAIEPDGAGRRQFQPGNHAQRRRLAAARGPQQAEELAVLHREAGSLDGMEIGEGFVERFDPYLCHPPYSLTFETMMNITVPNSVVANDQEYSVSEKRLHQHDDARGNDRRRDGFQRTASQNSVREAATRHGGICIEAHLRTAPKVIPRKQMLAQQHREYDDRYQKQRRAGGDRGPVLPALADDDRNEGRRRLRIAGGQEHREGVFVPGEDQAEDRGCRDTRRCLRQHHLHEGLKAGIAVDHGRFLVLARDLVDETFQQPDGERDVDRGVEQDHAEPRVRQPDGAVHQIDRDRDRDRRHHPRRQDEEQQIVLQRHAEPRETRRPTTCRARPRARSSQRR